MLELRLLRRRKGFELFIFFSHVPIEQELNNE